MIFQIFHCKDQRETHPVVAKQRWHGLLSSKRLRVLQIQSPALSNKGLIDSSISQCFQWRLGTNGTYAPLRSRKRKKLKTYQLNIFSHGSLLYKHNIACMMYFIYLFIYLIVSYIWEISKVFLRFKLNCLKEIH